MKTAFTLFVLLMTPTKECVDRVTKENLAGCREGGYESPWFINGNGFVGSGESGKRMTCDLKPEKDRKPIPQMSYKISLERPDVWDLKRKDDCYEYKIGVIEPKIDERPEWLVFTSTTTTYWVVGTTVTSRARQ